MFLFVSVIMLVRYRLNWSPLHTGRVSSFRTTTFASVVWSETAVDDIDGSLSLSIAFSGAHITDCIPRSNVADAMTVIDILYCRCWLGVFFVQIFDIQKYFKPGKKGNRNLLMKKKCLLVAEKCSHFIWMDNNVVINVGKKTKNTRFEYSMFHALLNIIN